MTLRAKASLLFAALVVGVVAINSAVLLRLHEDSLRQSILAAARATAQSASLTVSSFLDNTLQETQAIATEIPVEALRGRDRQTLERKLQRALAMFPKFENGLFLLDREGKFVTDYPVHPDLAGTSFAYREYFRATLAGNRGVVGEPYRSARTGQPVLTFTAPIRDGDGRIIGVLAASVQLLSARALGGVRMQRLGETGYVYVFDATRMMILHPSDERVLSRDVKPGANRLFDAAIDGFEGIGETVNSLGVPMLAAVKRIPGTRWILVSQQTASEVFAPVVQARQRLIVTTLGSVLTVVALGLLAIRRLTQPLVRLKAAAEEASGRLADGGAPVHSGTVREIAVSRGNDEIGLLAGAFETLASRLDSAVGTLRQSARDWQLTFDSVTDLVFVTDAGGVIVRANQTARNHAGRAPEALEGESLAGVLFGARTGNRPSLTEEGHGELDDLTIDGQYEFKVTALARSERDQHPGFVCVLHDVTAARAAARLVEEMAYFDSLTALPNRRLVLDRMRQAFRSAERHGAGVAVMFIDLDRFKSINDTHGHAAGDRLLREVARRITGCLRASDTVGRFGGDEFVIVLDEVRGRDDAATAAAKIVAAVRPEIDIEAGRVTISVSIGIAIYPEHGREPDQVLAAADKALYEVKQAGRNGYRFSGDPIGDRSGTAPR
jgi:diguanylate cyclase (GGDEF)-like protein